MSINEIYRKQTDHLRQKRTSINNSNGAYRSEKMDRPERLSDKPIDKMRKMMQRMENNIKQHPFQMFDLHEIQENTHLINKNRKFANLLNSLKMYNKKLAQKRQLDVVNYKLYQFYYSTLKICNTKTDTEVQFYLRQVDNWFNMYSHKRQLLIYPNKKKQNKKNEDDAIRQTFKSYLPLQIDEYRRKVCLLPSYKQLQEREKAKRDKDKDNDLDGSDDDLQYARDLMDQKENKQERGKKQKEEIQLPNLRCYRNQLLKMRKAIEEKQQGNIMKNLKKNQARILIQSSNNFYQPLRNRNDTFNKNQHAEQEISKKHVEDDNFNANFKENSREDKQAKNNHKLIVNSTAMGFYEIKKRNLNMTLGHKKNQASVSEFPKFFMQSGSKFSNNIHQLSYEGKSDHSGRLNNSFTEVQNISGLSLMRNPFQITKGKKEKKSK